MNDKENPRKTSTAKPEQRPPASPAITFTQPPQTPQKTAGNSLFVGPRKPALHTTLQFKAPSAARGRTAAPTAKVEAARQENEGGPAAAEEADGNVA